MWELYFRLFCRDKVHLVFDISSVDKKPKLEKLIKVFSELKDIKERNRQIVKAYQQSTRHITTCCVWSD